MEFSLSWLSLELKTSKTTNISTKYINKPSPSPTMQLIDNEKDVSKKQCLVRSMTPGFVTSRLSLKKPYDKVVLEKVIFYLYSVKIDCEDLNHLLELMELLNLINLATDSTQVEGFRLDNIRKD